MLNGIGQRRTNGMLSLCTLGWVAQGQGGGKENQFRKTKLESIGGCLG